MMIAEVRIYLANWRVGDWATVGNLAAREIGCLVKTGCLMKTDGGPEGGYRQKNDERMYTTVYGGVLGEEALHCL